MTTQELFIGHFEGALSPEESLHLETILSGSAELRAQFDQHQQVHSMMVREAQETKPSDALDEATIGAALGLLGQTIGGTSIAFWSGTKIAATIGAVVVGGTVTWFAVTKNSEPQPPSQPQTPVATQPAPAIQTAPLPQLQEQKTMPEAAKQTDNSNKASTKTSDKSAAQAKSTEQTQQEKKSGISFDRPPDATVNHEPEMRNTDQK